MTVTFSTAGATTWKAPCGVTSITVECWGAGGAGGPAQTTAGFVGGGGSGGAYTKGTFTVVPGTTYNLSVGAGGTGPVGADGSAGNPSWFQNTTTILAVGGGGGKRANGAISVGAGAAAVLTGNINTGTGVVNFYGGAGGTGAQNTISGGGGSSAGTASAGNNAVAGVGGGAVAGGGAGANGVTSGVGLIGGSPGSGGSGGYRGGSNAIGGTGGTGKVVITYTGTQTYCSPVFSGAVEPITYVNFAGINNNTSSTIGGTPSNEQFCLTGNVSPGLSYPIYISGNTNGNFIDYIRFYADWNNNGLFTDPGESYYIGSLQNSTGSGIDAGIITTNIDVPVGASTGTTVMRVIKRRASDPTNPCLSGTEYGQAEDYQLNITSVPACSSPVAQPTALSLTSITQSSIAVSFTPSASANNYLVIRTTTATPPSAPVNGTTYNLNSFALGGVVDYTGSASSYVSSALTPNTTYWYWIFAVNNECLGQPLYLTASPLNGNATTLACAGLTTNTMSIPGGPSAIYYWSNAALWSLGHVPTACEDVVVRYNNSNNNAINEKATVILDASATINSLLLVGNYGASTNGQFELKELKFLTNGHNLNILSSLIVGSTGGVDNMISALPQYAHTSVFLGTDSLHYRSQIKIGGNLTVSRTTDNQLSALGGLQGANPLFLFNSGVTYNSYGNSLITGHYIFDKSGFTNITNNMLYYPLLFQTVSIGYNNTNNVSLAGTGVSKIGIYGGNLTINSGSTLRLPSGAGFSQLRTAGTPEGTFTMGSNAKLEVGGTTSSVTLPWGVFPGCSGSNFPANFATYSLATSSEVNYNSVNAVNQTVYAPVTYGDLIISNATGSGSCVKSLIANITNITGDLTIRPFSEFNLNTFLANRITAGGTLTINQNATMRLTGTTGGAGGGSNFPKNFSNFVIGETSTTIYDAPANQKINGVPNYGNLILAGSGVKTNAPVSLGIKGDLIGLGSATFFHNNAIINMIGDTHAQNYSATNPFTFFELKNNNSHPGGFNINSNLSIVSILNLGAGSKLNLTGGNITLRSDASGTANVGIIPSDATISYSGSFSFIVERYLYNDATIGGRKWRLLSVPTSSTTQTIYNSWQENGDNSSSSYGFRAYDPRADWATRGFDGLGGNSSVKIPDPVNNGQWIPVTNTNTVNIAEAKKGYIAFVFGPRSFNSFPGYMATTLRTKGTLYTGTQTPITIAPNKFDLISNPYASRIDVRLLNISGLDNAIYVWDPSLGGTYGLGGWNTLVKVGSDYQNLLTSNIYGTFGTVNNFIESGSAFMVKAGSSGGSIQFEEAIKSTGSRIAARNESTHQSGTTSILPSVRVHLKVRPAGTTNNLLLDGMLAIFNSTGSNNIDHNDIKKLVTTGESVGWRSKDSLLVVENRNIPLDNDTLQFDFIHSRLQNYQWEIVMDGLNIPGLEAFLFDKYSNTITPLNLSGTTIYDFNIQNIVNSWDPKRFAIFFKKLNVVPVKFINISARREENKSCTIKWNIENEIDIERYEIERSPDGSIFNSIGSIRGSFSNSNTGTYTYQDHSINLSDIFYRIRSKSVSGESSLSRIVKIEKVVQDNYFYVYPNPILNNKINIRSINPAINKTYEMRLFNSSGQCIARDIYKPVIGNEEISLVTEKLLPAGIYHLIIKTTDGFYQELNVIKPGN